MADSAVLLANLYDIQQQYSSTQTIIDANAPRCTVDVENRTINVPKNVDSLGVQYDHRSKAIYFEIDRYINGIDLLTQICVVQWINGDIEKGNMGFYPIILYDNSVADRLTLVWEIHDESTQIAGDLHFALRFYTLNDKRTFEWSFNTLPAKSIIKDTLDVQMSSTIEIQPSVLSVWNYRIASLERMATEAVESAAYSAIESQAWAIGHPSIPERVLDNSKYYKEMTQAIYNTTNEELHDRVYNEGKKIADKLWLLPDEETIIRLDDEYTIGVPTATTEKRGVVIVGDGTKIENEILSIDTEFDNSETLEALVSGENFKPLLTKLAKTVSTVIGLDNDAVLKAMMSNVNVDDENMIPTSAYIYKLAERIGIDVDLNGDISLTDGANKLPQLREDIDNLTARIYENNVENFISFNEQCQIGLTIFTTSETTENLPSEESVWINASGLLFKISDLETRIVLFNKEYTQIATMSCINGFLNPWTIGVCRSEIDSINDGIQSINTSISNINTSFSALETSIENFKSEINDEIDATNNNITILEGNYKQADVLLNERTSKLEEGVVDLTDRVFKLEKKHREEVEPEFETINGKINSINENFNNYDTVESVNSKFESQETAFNNTLKDYAKTESVNTQISNLQTTVNDQIADINDSLADYAKATSVEQSIKDLSDDIDEKFQGYYTSLEIDEKLDDTNNSFNDYMSLSGGILTDGKITSAPIEDTDIVNKLYLDNAINNIAFESNITIDTILLENLGEAELISCDKFVRFIFSGETSVDFGATDEEGLTTAMIGTLPEGIEIHNDSFERVVYIMGYGACVLSIINGEIFITYEQTIPVGTKIIIYEIIAKKQVGDNNENIGNEGE